MRKAALIDLDGTLIDTIADIHCAVAAVATTFKLAPVSLEEVKGWVGKGSRHLIQTVLDRGERQVPVELDQAMQVFGAAYHEVNGRLASIYPGVIEGLTALGDAGIACACVTNKHQSATDELLEKLGLSRHFSLILGGDTGLALKPDAAPLLSVCARLDVAPVHAVMVGDSDNDLLAARAAGCACILLPYGYSVGKPVHTLGADAIVPTLLAAAHWIVARPLLSAHHA